MASDRPDIVDRLRERPDIDFSNPLDATKVLGLLADRAEAADLITRLRHARSPALAPAKRPSFLSPNPNGDHPMSLDTSLTAHYEAVSLLWNAYFGTRDADRPLSPLDVGHMLSLVELDRANRFGDYNTLGQTIAGTATIAGVNRIPKALDGNSERRSTLDEVKHRAELRRRGLANETDPSAEGGDRSGEKSIGA